MLFEVVWIAVLLPQILSKYKYYKYLYIIILIEIKGAEYHLSKIPRDICGHTIPHVQALSSPPYTAPPWLGVCTMTECSGEDGPRKRSMQFLEMHSEPLLYRISESGVLEYDLEGQPGLGKSPWWLVINYLTLYKMVYFFSCCRKPQFLSNAKG